MNNAQKVDIVHDITESEFLKYVDKRKPVIIRNLVKDWPALGKWNTDFFINNYPQVTVQAVGVKNNKVDLSPKHGAVISINTFNECIPLINDPGSDGKSVIATTMEHFPETLKMDCPPLQIFKNGKYLRSRLFIGPKFASTALHQDLFENLYTIIEGEKKIILYRPSQKVYRNSIFSKLPNFSQVDIEQPDFDKFPLFKGERPYEILLNPGETLYIPSFWWHYLKNLEKTVAVSYWWSVGWKVPVVWAALTYKKYRGI